MYRIVLLINLGLLPMLVLADSMSCALVVYKSNCWQDYEVMIDVRQAMTQKQLVSLTIPQGKNHQEQTFDCRAGDPLSIKARFDPPIFVENRDRIYPANKIYMVPLDLPKDTVKWLIKLCYPDDFQSVPLPPILDQQCACEISESPKNP